MDENGRGRFGVSARGARGGRQIPRGREGVPGAEGGGPGGSDPERPWGGVGRPAGAHLFVFAPPAYFVAFFWGSRAPAHFRGQVGKLAPDLPVFLGRGRAGQAGQSEVDDLHLSLAAHQHVLRAGVSVDDRFLASVGIAQGSQAGQADTH